MSARNRSANAIRPTSANGGAASVPAIRDSYTSFGQLAGMPTSTSGTRRLGLRVHQLPAHAVHAHAPVVLGDGGQQSRRLNAIVAQCPQRERRVLAAAP